MKLIKSLAVIGALVISSMAMASDLQEDLKTPFEPLTNPFNSVQEVKLNANLATTLTTLLQRCAFVPSTKSEDGFETLGLAELKADCDSAFTVSRDKGSDGVSYISNKMKITLKGIVLYVISWDGSDSDGGDEQALGIYDVQGNRIAVYPSLHVDGNVIDGLAHALDTDLPKVQK